MSAQPKLQPSPRPLLVPIRDESDWHRDLLCYEGSLKPIPNTFNARLAFLRSPEWAGVLWYDEFRHRTMIGEAPPWGGDGDRVWLKRDSMEAAAWLCEKGIGIHSAGAEEAAVMAAARNPQHPLKDFLINLCWDGRPRVETWLHDYLGAEDTQLTRAIGQCWLISAIARAFNPGCQADHCLILEGLQGIGKSTGIKLLAGKEFFGVHIAQSFANRDAAILCDGVWIMEFSELQSLRGAKVEDVKAFISNTVDHYRPVWGSQAIDVPRSCVFAGTTNHEQYFEDDTGNRRFWPVNCRHTAVETIENDREQIWAEAVYLFNRGEQWHLSKPLENMAAEEQKKRRFDDAWTTVIRDYVSGKSDVNGTEVLSSALKLLPKDQTNAHLQRVAKCLIERIGWEHYRVPGSGAHRYRPMKKGSHRPSLNPDKAWLP